jgi:hypothetical protein
MNDERRLPAPSAAINLAASEGSSAAGLQRAPELLFAVTLEGLPTMRIVADSFEDELRLRRWLRSPGSRRRLLDAVLDGLNELAA